MYSIRNHITQEMSKRGSRIAANEKAVDDLVGKVFTFLQENPGSYAKDAVNRVMADNA